MHTASVFALVVDTELDLGRSIVNVKDSPADDGTGRHRYPDGTVWEEIDVSTFSLKKQ